MALRRVRPDRPALPALALRGSGSGLPAEESPQERPHRVMKGAAGDVQTCVGLPGPSSASTAGWTESGQAYRFLLSVRRAASRRRESEAPAMLPECGRDPSHFIEIMHLRWSSRTQILKTV